MRRTQVKFSLLSCIWFLNGFFHDLEKKEKGLQLQGIMNIKKQTDKFRTVVSEVSYGEGNLVYSDSEHNRKQKKHWRIIFLRHPNLQPLQLWTDQSQRFKENMGCYNTKLRDVISCYVVHFSLPYHQMIYIYRVSHTELDCKEFLLSVFLYL